jgi:hypothetical protein
MKRFSKTVHELHFKRIIDHAYERRLRYNLFFSTYMVFPREIIILRKF